MTPEDDRLQNNLQHFQNDILNIRCLSSVSKLIYLFATFSLCLHIPATEHDRGTGFDWRHCAVLRDESGW
jgi:hypothetical protein